MAEAAEEDATVEYARRLFATVVAWYDNADRKGQLILAANGGFLTVLAGFGLAGSAEVEQTVRVFGPETWTFVGLATAGILCAFASAARVLWSRLLTRRERERIFDDHKVRVDDPSTYDPAILWFFQLFQHLDEGALEWRLANLTARDERDALVDQSIRLAKNVATKHFWVNIGFTATAVALSFLLATVVSYAVRLA